MSNNIFDDLRDSLNFGQSQRETIESISNHVMELEPIPMSTSDNQEKQIELMVEMVNKQSEMIKQQEVLIETIHTESKESSKLSKLAIAITVANAVICLIQTLIALVTLLL